MGTPTYKPLATKTLTATATSVTFSSIGQGFRDLVLVATLVPGSGASTLRYNFNGDATAANYSSVAASGDGATASSSTEASGANAYLWLWINAHRDQSIANFMDYSATDKHKTVLARLSDSTYGVQMAAGRWASTAAMTSIAVSSNVSFVAGSVFTLYGIASA